VEKPGCVFYGFSFDGDEARCREGYENAEALLKHLENVVALLEEALNPQFFTPRFTEPFLAAGVGVRLFCSDSA